MSATTPRKPQPSPLDRFTERLDEWFFLTDTPKTLAKVREELAADGCKTSLDSLSRWRQRRERERAQTNLSDWTEEFEAQCRAFNPSADSDQVRQFVIAQLIKKGAATGDDTLALNAARMQLEEKSGATKAANKERELALAENRFHFDTAKACLAHAPFIKTVAGNKSLSESEKIQAIRARLWGKPPTATSS